MLIVVGLICLALLAYLYCVERTPALASQSFDVSDGESAASTFAWSPDGYYVAVLSRLTRKVRVFDVRTGELVARLEDLAGGASSVDFDASGNVICGPAEGPRYAVTIWNFHTGALRSLVGPDGSETDSSGNMLLEFAVDRVSSRLLGVYQLPEGSREHSALVLYNLTTGKMLKLGSPPGMNLSLSPSGKWAAFRGKNGPLQLLEIDSGKLAPPIAAHLSGVKVTAWSPTGEFVATGGQARAMMRDPVTDQVEVVKDLQTLKIWNVKSASQVDGAKLPEHVSMLDFNPDGRLLAAADGYGVIHVLDTTNLTNVIATIPPGERQSVVARFSPDGTKLARLLTHTSTLVISDVATLGQ